MQDDPSLRARIADANELKPRNLRDHHVRDLLAFLHALTDHSSLDLRIDVPKSVPSGLPIFD